MSDGNSGLGRFLTAQDPVIEAVLRELRAGRKRTHWMWFIFPQLRGLGSSSTAQFYGIADFDEARAYLAHPVLAERLTACTYAVTNTDGRTLREIFGSPDDAKFRSSMTLFALASPGGPNAFRDALQQFCGGELDPRTVERIND